MGFGSWGCLGTLILGFGDVWIGLWKVLKVENEEKMAGSRLGRGPVLVRRGPSLKKVEEALLGGAGRGMVHVGPRPLREKNAKCVFL